MRWAGGALALLLGAIFALFLLFSPVGDFAALVVDDLIQLLAATTAALFCAWRARHGLTQRRLAWCLLALGTACWAAGQGIWTWYEVGKGREVPFPSLADVGFLAFSVLTAAGLLAWIFSTQRLASRARDLVDGAVIAGSLLVVSWATALGSTYVSSGGDPLALLLSMAYPVGDVMLFTVMLLAVARAPRAQRAALILLAAGLGGLAAADSAYVYLIAVGNYTSGNLISAGWVTGFLLIAAGAAADPSTAPIEVEDDRPSWLRLTLPYLPIVAAVAVVSAQYAMGEGVPTVELVLGVVLVALVLIRQFLVLADNRTLLLSLREREAELAHRAFHDPLTGLANRALFLDRIEQLIAWHDRDGRGLTVMFCDLDNFKDVNDTLGHAAGDALLIEVAGRLRGCLRSVDTVARLGGDEFAVLLEQPHEDPATVADRIVTAVGRAATLQGGTVSTSVSIGVAVLAATSLPTGEPALPPYSASATSVIAAADRAMYTAKAEGKGCAVVVVLAAEDDPLDELSALSVETAAIPWLPEVTRSAPVATRNSP